MADNARLVAVEGKDDFNASGGDISTPKKKIHNLLMKAWESMTAVQAGMPMTADEEAAAAHFGASGGGRGPLEFFRVKISSGGEAAGRGG